MQGEQISESGRWTASVVHAMARLQTKSIQPLPLFHGTEQAKSEEVP